MTTANNAKRYCLICSETTFHHSEYIELIDEVVFTCSACKNKSAQPKKGTPKRNVPQGEKSADYRQLSLFTPLTNRGVTSKNGDTLQ